MNREIVSPLIEKVMPYLVNGFLGFFFVLSGFRAVSGTNNLHQPTATAAYVCPLEKKKHTTLFPEKPHVAYRYGSRRWNITRPTSSIVCDCQRFQPTAISATLLVEEVSQIEEVDANLAPSDSSESSYSYMEEVSRIEGVDALSDSSELSEFSNYDDSVDVSPETFDVVILRKQNQLTRFLEASNELDPSERELQITHLRQEIELMEELKQRKLNGFNQGTSEQCCNPCYDLDLDEEDDEADEQCCNPCYDLDLDEEDDEADE